MQRPGAWTKGANRMSERSVDHLGRAKEYIGRGDEYYRQAAAEIVAAREADPTLGYREIAERLGRSDHWCRKLVTHFTSATDPAHGPFGGPDENEARYARHDRRKVEEIIQERPEAVAEAIERAGTEAQRKIADAIATGTVDRSLKDVAQPREHAPRPKKSTWQRLSEATFDLWQVAELLKDEVPSGEQKIRMLASAEKAARLAHGIAWLLDTGEIEDEFARLLEEMGAEA